MNLIIFEKTGNFWIDNGIVGLYKVLKELERKEMLLHPCDIKLHSDRLTINLKSEEEEPDSLTKALNQAKSEVVKNYLKQTDGAGWIYKDYEFEVYQKTDFKMHLKPFFTGKTPSTEGALLVPEAKDAELGGKGHRMTDEEYQKFLLFKETNSPVIINDKRVPLTGKGFLNSPPRYEIGEEFSEEFEKEGKKRCLFSGKFYQKAGVITGMDYPFLTGKSGELNFASFLTEKPSISSRYAFIALFSFYNLNYLIQDNLKNYFMLYDGNLEELSNFYNVIKDIRLVTRQDYCSFETEITGTQYENESLFNFLLSVFKRVQDKIDHDKYKGILFSKSVFTLSNDGNIFREVKEYSSITELFNLFDTYAETEGDNDERNHLEAFINFIRYFNKRLDGGKCDTTWRNRICSDILSFRSIHKTLEWFMGEVKLKEESASIFDLDNIIKIYNNKTQEKMDEKMIELCRNIGYSIGKYCSEKQDKGILFSIRNAKSKIEFLNVLAETQFRTQVSYSENFFKMLPDKEEWEEYKALVSIFAMNRFLFKEKKQS